jgi:hypothetical protein
MKMLLAASAIAFAGLAACSPSAPATDGATAAAPESAPAPAAPAPAAAEGPAPGKWKMTTTMMGQTMPATEICIDKRMSFEETQNMQRDASMKCSEQSFGKEGDVHVGHSVCAAEIGGRPVTMTTDIRATGDFKSKYTVDMTMKMDPAVMGMGEQKMSTVAERLGDCDPK